MDGRIKLKKPAAETKYQLNFKQSDLLRELGNICSGRAVTALSILTGKNVTMTISNLNVLPFYSIMNSIHFSSPEVFSIISRVSGAISLWIVQLYSKEGLLGIIDKWIPTSKLDKGRVRSFEDLDVKIRDGVTEVGNILAGNYATAIANVLHQRLIPSIPIVLLDHVNAIIDGMVAQCVDSHDQIILVSSQMVVDSMPFEGIIAFFPEASALPVLFSLLKKEEGASTAR